jgi:hypothetical protein
MFLPFALIYMHSMSGGDVFVKIMIKELCERVCVCVLAADVVYEVKAINEIVVSSSTTTAHTHTHLSHSHERGSHSARSDEERTVLSFQPVIQIGYESV